MPVDHSPLVIKTTITIADIEPLIWRRILPPRGQPLIGVNPPRPVAACGAARDPGCVKTWMLFRKVEFPSRFRSYEKQQRSQHWPRRQNAENNSRHFLKTHVFTQPGPKAAATPGRWFRGYSICRHIYASLACVFCHCFYPIVITGAYIRSIINDYVMSP
jgi:hypothetical protein